MARRRDEPAARAARRGDSSRGAAFSDWIGSLSFSGFTVTIIALVILGALVVSPTLSTYVQQQREIAELRESVRLHREAVAETDAERLKWQDPTYVRSQARGRLFYVMPGETQLSVIDDVTVPAESDELTSDELTRISRNWAEVLVASTLVAGTTTASPEELLGADGGQESSGADPAGSGATAPETTKASD